MICLTAFNGSGQTFSFDPGDQYTGLLEMDIYTEHQVNVYHDSPDSAYIKWRFIENTCPAEWDFQLCDWQHCYSGMPNTAEMLPVAAGNAGYLKLIVNPYETDGSGYVHFWIFPVGHMDEHVDLFFNFNTTASNIGTPANQAVPTWFNNMSKELVVKSDGPSTTSIYDMRAQLITTVNTGSGSANIPLAHLAPGAYICTQTGRKPYKFIIE